MSRFTVEGQPGENIYTAARRVEAAASAITTAYELTFNGIKVIVYPGSDARDIAEKYELTRQLHSAWGSRG